MNFRHKWLFILLCAGFVSCEKVIEIDIKDSEMRYVIEGVVTDEPGTCYVLLSKTVKFSEPNVFPGVAGAVVKVSDNGNEATLLETSPGIYTTNLINGTPGHVYDLYVAVGGKVFTATCTMKQPVPLDSLYIAQGPFGAHKFANIIYTDPAGVKNGYRFIQYLNGVRDPAVFWASDEFSDGQTTSLWLDNGVTSENDPRAIHSGDSVKVELLSLDETVFRFWSTVQFGGAAGSAYTASPANPVTNVKGGALGYFSAHAVRSRAIKAP